MAAQPVDTERLKTQVDILAVIGRYVELQRSGSIWKGLCPFHQEHSPSFVVYPDSERGPGSWHCFGACNMGGDVIDFVQKTEGVDFREAAERLVSGPPAGKPSPLPGAAKLPAVVVLPPDLHLRCHRALDEPARLWWHEQGIGDEAIARFFLGVCDHPAYGRCYTIPIIEGGTLVNLRLRLAAPPPDGDNRYRPWAKGLGSQLYNRDVLTPELGEVVVVAGEKKVVVLWQHGIPAVSPTNGCGAWQDEWTTALQFCGKVNVVFDPTEGPAAWRLAERIGERAFVTELPEKPDDFISLHGPTEFRWCLLNAAPYADRDHWRRQYGGPPLWGKELR